MRWVARLLAAGLLTFGLIGGAIPPPAAGVPTAVDADSLTTAADAEPATVSATADEPEVTVKQAGSTKRVKIAKRCKTKKRVLCIDKTRRKVFFVRRGKVVKTLDARFGCGSTPTRQGTFKVRRKNRHWTSTIYHSKMPYSMFFSGGQAVHYSADFKRRGYAGCSHGCVNIRQKKKLRYVFQRIRVGDRVVVYRS